MLGEIVGYVKLKPKTTTGISAISIEQFFDGQIVRVLEFSNPKNYDSENNIIPEGCLVISNNAAGIATFDKEDILLYFECHETGDVLMPKKLKDDPLQAAMYMTNVKSRKGGYNNILKNMVIAASLMKNKFNDNFLFQQQ